MNNSIKWLTPHECVLPLHGRLARFRKWSNLASDWEDVWATRSVEAALSRHANGYLGEFEIIARHFQKNRPILEAGCGIGQIVKAFHARGYDVSGVDFAEHTVARVREAAPDLDVRVGDVHKLDIASGALGGYISLGVVEHDPDGPMPILNEARRVLHPEGCAVISVPYLNAWRQKLFDRLRQEKAVPPDGVSFYQYYFSKEEFSGLLKQAGFDVIDTWGYAVYWACLHDRAVLQWLKQRNFFHWRIHRAFRNTCEHAGTFTRKRWAHMMLFICRPSA